MGLLSPQPTMRNSVVPLSASSSSQLYNFGNSGFSEAQVMPSLDISSFCWDSIAFCNYQLDPPPAPLAPAGFHIPPHQQESFTAASYDPSFDAAAWYGYSPFSACDTTSSSESVMMSNKVTSTAAAASALIENELPSKHGSPKRAIEVSSRATKSTATATGKRKRSSSTTCAGKRHQQQMNDHQSIQEFKLQVPVRRSQKLSDKITALQKLVSPYGKTDTASVLQEASIYIKLLQKQIQMLSNRATSSYTDDLDNEARTTTIEGELSELRNRGLCLVPLSMMTRKFADQCLVMDPSPYQEDQAEV